MGSHIGNYIFCLKATRRKARMLIQNDFDPNLTVKIVRNFRLNKFLLPQNNTIPRRRMSCHLRAACRPIAERRHSENISRNLDTTVRSKNESIFFSCINALYQISDG